MEFDTFPCCCVGNDMFGLLTTGVYCVACSQGFAQTQTWVEWRSLQYATLMLKPCLRARLIDRILISMKVSSSRQTTRRLCMLSPVMAVSAQTFSFQVQPEACCHRSRSAMLRGGAGRQPW